MNGVQVTLASNGTFWTHPMAAGKPYRAFPEAYAAALVELADAVPYHVGNLSTAEAKRIIAILDCLDAAKAMTESPPPVPSASPPQP